MVPTTQIRPGYRRLSSLLLGRSVGFHDRYFTESNKLILKENVIRLSVAGFALHLILIFVTRSLAHPPALLSEIGTNYLNAISTPFNFILFYEVLTLIAALPASTTRSIANQFEIVSLIYIRDVFTMRCPLLSISISGSSQNRPRDPVRTIVVSPEIGRAHV